MQYNAKHTHHIFKSIHYTVIQSVTGIESIYIAPLQEASLCACLDVYICIQMCGRVCIQHECTRVLARVYNVDI